MKKIKERLRSAKTGRITDYTCQTILYTLQNNFPSNPWYDKECKSLKYVVNNIAKHRDFNAQQDEYNILLRQYKQLIQRKKRQYQQAKLSELENMRTEDPNSYWKFWKSLNPRNVTTGPTLEDFVNYFEQQVYPPHVDYFDYEHMNNIVKQVTSFQHNVEHDKSNMTQFLNSPITAEDSKVKMQESSGCRWYFCRILQIWM